MSTRAQFSFVALLVMTGLLFAGASEKAEPQKEGQPEVQKGTQKETHKESQKEPTESPANDSRPIVQAVSGCVVDQTAIDDVRKARQEIEAKKKELGTKETELKAREQALTDQLKMLDAARKELSKVQEAKSKEYEQRVSKLVETIIGMSPKAASKLLSSIDEDLAVATIYRMDTPRLSKIMNVMDPKSSSKLTELMMGVITDRKGGEKDDKRNEQQHSAGRNIQPAGKQSSAGEKTQKSNGS